MRPERRASLAERIERTVRFIESRARLGDTPSLAEMAAEAALSEYHFHRLFRVMTGESPAAAVTRIRLAHSLPALAGEGIGAATGRSGYATSQAYARALRATAGVSPSQLRADAARRDGVAAALARPVSAGDHGELPLRIEVLSFEPLRLMTWRNTGAYEELNQGYGRLFELLTAQIAPDAITGIYGLPADDPRDTAPAACRFTCAFAAGEDARAEGGLEELHLPGGRHAVMPWLGDYDFIHEASDALYRWLLNADKEPAGPLLIEYLDDPEEVAADDLRALVWVPLNDAN